MAQRLVRAKARIRDAGIPFHLPERDELGERLDAVLDAVYAAFAEGWVDPGGGETRRRNLAGEALWLGRLTADLLPQEPEAQALAALMLYAESRRAARRNPAGAFVPLAQQDTALWDAKLIEEAETLLRRANRLPGTGRYQLEAAVQSAHAARRISGQTDWPAIAALYRALLALSGSPVVAVNLAAALSECGEASDALALLDAQREDKRLQDYQPYWAVRAAIHASLGQDAAADDAYLRAIGLEIDPSVGAFLERRRAMLPKPRLN
jgi:RNA polymerase sigma-70 factor (ECF subfamily)